MKLPWVKWLQAGLLSLAGVLMLVAVALYKSPLHKKAENLNPSDATVNQRPGDRGTEKQRRTEQAPPKTYERMLSDLTDRANSNDQKEQEEAFQALRDLREKDWNQFLSGVKEMTGRRAEASAKVIVEVGLESLHRLADYLIKEAPGLIHVPVLCTQLLGEASIPYLIEQTQSTSSRVRLWVAASLGNFVAHPKRILPALVSLATDSDEGVAIQALRSIQRFGTAAAPYLEQLRRITTEARPAVRSIALATLSMIAPDDQALASRLAETATSANAAVDERVIALEAIGRLPRTPATLAALEKCLSDMDQRIQRSTFDALLRGGPVPDALGRELLESLETGKASFPDKRLQVLGRLNALHDGLEPIAVVYLSSENLLERRSATACLAAMKRVKLKTVSAVLRCLDDEDVVVRMKAIETLMPYKDDQDVKQRLQKVLDQDKHAVVRAAAAMVLGKNKKGTP